MLRENAGYIIIKAEREESNKNFEVVLGTNNKNYVTWECKAGYDYFWGQYFTDYKEALKDYYTRLINTIE